MTNFCNENNQEVEAVNEGMIHGGRHRRQNLEFRL
jgi:hypothetical protein